MRESKKIKILFVASEYAKGMIPFATTIINATAQDERFEVHSLCVSQGRDYSSVKKEANPTILTYPKFKAIKLFYKLWPQKIIVALNSLEEKLKPDFVVFLTGDFSLSSFISLHNKGNYCYVVHDLHPHETHFSSMKDSVIHHLVTYGYKKLRYHIPNLVTCSHTQEKELRNMYPNKYIGFIPFPTLVTTAISKGEEKVHELKGIENYLLFFGNIQVYKGVDLLVKAYTNSSEYGKSKLVIAGQGDVSYIHDKNIICINRFINDEELKDLFIKAKYVIYPYRTATLSGVLSLAYYFKKVVLLSDIPFFREYATQDCIFFKPESIDDLANKISQLFVANFTERVDSTSYDSIYSKDAVCNALYDYLSRPTKYIF